MHPRSPKAHSVFGTGALLLCQPSAGLYDLGSTIHARKAGTLVNRKSQIEVAAQAGFAPTPYRLTGGRTTVIRLSNGAAGRSCTCIGSFRRRMPRLFRPRQRKSWIAGLVDWWIHGEKLKNPIIHSSANPFRKWSARQDLHLRSPGSRPDMLLLHHALNSSRWIEKPGR